MKKRLYRSESDQILAGVCSGLAEYFEVDPALVRFIFVIVTLLGGSGLMLYLILWIILPAKKDLELPSDEAIKHNTEEFKAKVENLTEGNSKYLLGFVIILIGLALLINNFIPFLSFFNLERIFWPFIVIFVGFLIIFRSFKNGK